MLVCKPARRTTTSAQGAKKLRGSKYVDLHSAHRWGQIAHRWGQNPLKSNNFGFPAPKTTVEPPLQSYRSPLFECEFNFGAAATAIEIELVEGICITKSLSFSEIAPDRRPYIYMGLRSPCERVCRPSPQERLQPNTSSPLLPRFLHFPSLSTPRLFCAWPPPEADRHCRQRAGGPCPTLPLPRGALRRLDRLAYGRSPRPVDLPLYLCLSSNRAGRFALDPNFEINFPFLSKMCDLRFSIRNERYPLPPFRNALRLEKNCELMRCSLNEQLVYLLSCSFDRIGTSNQSKRTVQFSKETLS